MIDIYSINFFRYSGKPRLQMDFLRDNGQVLLQVYSYKQMKLFFPQLDFGNETGYLLELNFSKSKTDNDINYRNFTLSDYYTQFRKFDDIKPKGAYFGFLKEEISDNDFSEYISKLLFTIYGDIQIECRVAGPA